MGNTLFATTNKCETDSLQPQFTTDGWRPDILDHRDLVITFPPTLPVAEDEGGITYIDLRDKFAPVESEKVLKNVTSHIVEVAIKSDMMKQQLNDTIKVDLATDTKGSIRDTIKKSGINSLTYRKLKQSRTQLRACLQHGYPIICGISIYQSILDSEVTKTGHVTLPEPTEKLLGGLCILLVGYDDENSVWIFRNSWGRNWGDEGYGYLPYRYLVSKSKLASDFWIIEADQKLSKPLNGSEFYHGIEAIDD